jgi:hypothetical protein
VTTYQFGNIDVFTKGYLKGYTNGLIRFFYNGKETVHEFLYRYEDDGNGPEHEIVSIDYGYLVPGIKELWNRIEKDIKEFTLRKLGEL